ncbi:serine hydrolase domain-containing protein [Nocardia donostiensis]|uniref:Hydrolase n=1 Tax=Nocardia donostiensis TaxID=1538463 RepID=A0A1V2TD56_9NOCA|nr:serine hydrolase [Nocardia donostiensis]ONM47447.1 hydrolase [Nocardia donostiensis]OQS14323.1 hydrolase [Nocardia donostiensis]OQS24086.1 hydrolase [Nocardia donostiensis]
MGCLGGLLAGVAAVSLVVGHVFTGGTAMARAEPGSPPAECEVQTGREPQRTAPEQVGLDPERLAAALDFAGSRNRLNVQVYRHNCLIGEGPTNAQTGNVAWNVWSVTKSVVSLLTGIAWDQGKIDIHAPIDHYLPSGLGDGKRRAITVENLLTETSGMRTGVITEGLTGIIPLDPNSAVQALGVPLDHEPGTVFSYSQRNVDLLAYVLELAVGEPLQQFAQRELFEPLGIARGDWYWARDRTGHTYGYAHLMIPPNDLAKIGLLVSNDGRWGARQIVSSDYLQRARTPSAANHCYGYLFWVGPSCAETPNFLPPDAYAMAGMGMQNIFFIPSLDLTVMWTGVYGNVSRHGLPGVLQNQTELPHEFFRRLFAAFHEPPVPDPGPYVEPPLRFDPNAYIDTDILLAVFGIGAAAYPGCNVFSCLHYPLTPPFSDAPPGCAVLVCLGTDPRTPGIR